MIQAIKIYFIIKKIFDELGGIYTAEKITEFIADIFEHHGAKPEVIQAIRNIIKLDEQKKLNILTKDRN